MSDVIGSFMDFIRNAPGHVLAILETPWPYVAEAAAAGLLLVYFEVRRYWRRSRQTGSSSR